MALGAATGAGRRKKHDIQPLGGRSMAKKRRAKRIARPKPLQNMVNTGPLGSLAAGASIIYYGNAAHLLSMMNRKAFHQVTRDGHLKNYGLELQVFNMVNASTAVYTAPLSYVTYNATRAWHFARKERYEDAGFKLSDLGYGSRLRFALDATMSGLNQSTSTLMIKPSALAHDVADKGEWDWSDVIITPPVDIGSSAAHSITVGDATDTFQLHLCGDHTVDTSESDETIQYSLVGMNQSWLENRRGWAAPSDEETFQPENPLAFARRSGLESYALSTEVADEQKQSPPYSNVDDDDAKSVFATKFLNGQLESKFPNPTTNNDVVVAPGGVFQITITNNDGDAGFPYVSCRIYEID